MTEKYCFKLFFYENTKSTRGTLSYIKYIEMSSSNHIVKKLCEKLKLICKNQSKTDEDIKIFNKVINIYRENNKKDLLFCNYHATYIAPEEFKNNCFIPKTGCEILYF